MKKLFNVLIITFAFGMVLSLVSCSPTFGLEEVSFEDIANANITGTYNVNSTVSSWDSEGNKSTSKASDTLSGDAVKTAVAASKVLIAAKKLVYSNSYGNVYANKSFSKIVVYEYIKDSNNKIFGETVTTYTKK